MAYSHRRRFLAVNKLSVNLFIRTRETQSIDMPLDDRITIGAANAYNLT